MSTKRFLLAVVAVAVLTGCGSSKRSQSAESSRKKVTVQTKKNLEKLIKRLKEQGGDNPKALEDAQKKKMKYKAAFTAATGDDIIVNGTPVTLTNLDANGKKFVSKVYKNADGGRYSMVTRNGSLVAGIYVSADGRVVKPYIIEGTPSSEAQIKAGIPDGSSTTTVFYSGSYTTYKNNGFTSGDMSLEAKFQRKTVAVRYDKKEAEQTGRMATNGVFNYGKNGVGRFFSLGEDRIDGVEQVAGTDSPEKGTFRVFSAHATAEY